MVPFIILVVVAVAAAVGVVWGATKPLKKYQRIRDTPTSPIKALKNGFYEIRGRVAQPAQALKSPFSETSCVYYSFSIRERKTTGYGKRRRTRWVTVLSESKMTDCFLEQGEHRAEVLIDRAELNFKVDHHGSSGILNSPSGELKQRLSERYHFGTEGVLFNRGLRYREVVVRAGELLYVLGECRTGADRAPVFEGGGDLFIVADRPEAEVARKYLWLAIGGYLLATLLGGGAIALVVWASLNGSGLR